MSYCWRYTGTCINTSFLFLFRTLIHANMIKYGGGGYQLVKNMFKTIFKKKRSRIEKLKSTLHYNSAQTFDLRCRHIIFNVKRRRSTRPLSVKFRPFVYAHCMHVDDEMGMYTYTHQLPHVWIKNLNESDLYKSRFFSPICQ